MPRTAAPKAGAGAGRAPPAAAAKPRPRPRVGPNEQETTFVRAFANTRIVQETLICRQARRSTGGGGAAAGGARVPTTIAAIERRWFAGRHTVMSAQEKSDALLPLLAQIGTPSIDLRSVELALVGTAAMFELEAQGTGLVHVQPSAQFPNFLEMRMAIAGRRRGRPKASDAVLQPPDGSSLERPAGAAVAAAAVGAPAAAPSGWVMMPEDGGVFAYGVRRILHERGLPCPPWDNTGHGTCSKEWRSLVDNKRVQFAKSNAKAVATIRPETVAKWDGRAEHPGYTQALCDVVANFRAGVEPPLAAGAAPVAAKAAAHQDQRVYLIHEPIATACRQLAQRNPSDLFSGPGPRVAGKTEVLGGLPHVSAQGAWAQPQLNRLQPQPNQLEPELALPVWAGRDSEDGLIDPPSDILSDWTTRTLMEETNSSLEGYSSVSTHAIHHHHLQSRDLSERSFLFSVRIQRRVQ